MIASSYNFNINQIPFSSFFCIRRKAILLLIICGYTNAMAQTVCEGVVKDAITHETLAYVNIGIVNQNVGTTSNGEGKFRISIDEQHHPDSLKISMVGYTPQLFKVSDFITRLAKDPEIMLQQDVHKLSEIIILGKRNKEKIEGNTTHSKKFRGGFTNSDLGNELGIVVHIQKRPTYIKNFNAFIVSNTSDSMKFRLNFYDLRNGLPHNRILNDQIVFLIPTAAGQFTIDLSNYNIVMSDDFFVSLELVENFGQKSRKGILFSAGFFGSSFIARETSQGAWKKYGAISLGFNVTTQY